MPPYGGRVSGKAVCPLHRGVASSEAEMICPLEGRFATIERGRDAGRSRESQWEPSSEAEMSCLLEGRFATLERGGDAGRSRGSRWEPSSEAEIAPRVRGGMRIGRMQGFFESFPFFKIGRRPWAQLANVCLHFLG